MNESLQSKLVEILTSIQAATGKASDFALSQLPDIAQSYVLYGRISLTSAIVLSLIVVIVLMVVGVKWSNKIDDGFPFFITFTASMFPIGVILTQFYPMLLVWFAPKVWLLKELAGMIK